MQLDLGGAFASLINWIQNNFGPLLDGIELVIGATIQGAKDVLLFLPSWAMIVLFTVLAWWVASRGVALFTVVGLTLLEDVEFALFGMEIAFGMGLWEFAMQTLALIATATLISLLVGIPVGIWAAKNDVVDAIVRPVLDFMQTMPAFVYLIPAVVLFGLGAVPGVIATFIFATPPCVRLTNLGIRQVSEEAVEAAESFGSTPSQMLFKVELPMALPTIWGGGNPFLINNLRLRRTPSS